MASNASDTLPVTGRVDLDGRLVSADDPLARLQQAAGSALGRALALPQLAALVRSAQSLQVPLSRVVVAANDAQDFDLWVRAEPDDAGVSLVIDRWESRAPAPARLDLISRYDTANDEVEAEATPSAETLEWAVDGDLKVSHLSPGLQAVLDLGEGEAIGQPLTKLFRLIEEEDGQMPLLRALASREDFDAQRAQSRGSGKDVTLTGRALVEGEGRFAGFRGTAHAEGVAASVASTSDDDRAMLDHALDSALRSPLDRIIDAADEIVDRNDGPLRSDYANYATDIAAAGRHLLSVIRSMSSSVAGEHASIDIFASVLEALALTKADAEARMVEVGLDHPRLDLSVRGEGRGIVQILVNIVGNAIRHSPVGGTVAVLFNHDADGVEVIVADQGPGIAKADQQRIFERYEQGETAAQGGTGLGLAISRRLARSMGGDITVASAPGEGARFVLRLPRP